MKKRTLIIYLFANTIVSHCFSQQKETAIWNVGRADNSVSEFALAPNGFKNFVGKDFGYEDKFFLIGYSKEKTDFPYVLPGPADTWGGTWPTAGWRTNQVNILFGINHLPANGNYKLVMKVLDYAKKFLPLIKVSINDQDEKIQLGSSKYGVNKQPNPRLDEPYIDTLSLIGNLSSATPEMIEIPIKGDIIKKGGNKITNTQKRSNFFYNKIFSLALDSAPDALLEKKFPHEL